MAQFDAQINLILSAQKALKEADKAAKEINKKFNNLKVQVGRKGPLDTYIQQNDELVKQKQIQNEIIKNNKAQTKQAEETLSRQLRLTAAQQRQETIVKALNRAGGPNNKAAQDRVEGALAASKAAKDSLNVQHAVNVLLEKELQIRREINRVRLVGDEAKSVGASRRTELSSLGARGATAGQLKELRSLNQAYIDAAEKGETDIAKAVDRRYKRKFKLLERDLKATETVAKKEKAEADINRELDLQAQQYADLDRLQRQLLANDNSRIKANRQLTKTQQFIQDRISIGRAKRRSAALRGNENQYPTTIGPVPDFIARNRAIEESVAKTQRIAVAEQRLAKTRTDAAARQSQFAKLQRAENKAKLEGARDTAEAAGSQKAYNTMLDAAVARFNETIAANKRLTKSENDKRAAINQSTKDNANAAAKRRNRLVEDLQLGVGFPLLFGGGAGSVTGGALGALASQGEGGFGSQILFSAVGGALDDFVVSIGKLGQALNPATADVNAVIEAAGLANTALGKTISELEGTAGSAAALKEATKELERVVGADGVQALEEFGDRFASLGSQLAQFFTQIQVAVAKLLQESPTEKNIRETGEVIFQARSSENVKIQDAISRLDSSSLPKERLAIQAEIVNLVNEEAAARQRELEALTRSTGQAAFNLRQLRSSNAEKQIELDLTQLNAVANDKTRIALEKKLAFQQRQTKEQALYNQFALDEISIDVLRLKLAAARLDFETQIAAIANAAANYKPPSSGQVSESRALQLQQQLVREDLKRADLAVKYIELTKGTTLAAQAQEALIQKRLEDETKIIELQRKQALEQNTVAGDIVLINQLYDSRTKTLEETLALEQAQNNQRTAAIELERKLDDTVRNAVAPIRNIREEHERSLMTQKEYSRLLMEGMLPAEAKRISEFNEQVRIQLKKVDAQILLVEASLVELQNNELLTKEYQEQLDKLEALKKARGAIENEGSKGPGGKPKTDRDIIQSRVDELQGELNEMTKLGNVAVKVADNIGAAFSTAFQDVINGSKSTQQALSDMFRTIGENFVAMAADIIAQQIQMIILQTILKALGAAVGGSSGSDVGFDTSTPLPGGMEFGHLASGGPAEANRPYMVGERGPELFVPSQSGGVMRNEDMRQMMGRSPAGVGAPQMNFTFETTNIGGTEFVSREQLEVAMSTTRRQAASDGAKQGMSMTLDKMQNSPRTRSRVGIR